MGREILSIPVKQRDFSRYRFILCKEKQVDGRGHVKYTSPTLIVTGDHVFYDEIARILNGDGNGTYNYLPRKRQERIEVGFMT